MQADLTTVKWGGTRGRSTVFMFENPFRPDYFGVYDLCEGNGKSLPGLPSADIVVLRADYQPTPTGQAVLTSMKHYQVLRFEGTLPMHMYINPNSPRRARLDAAMQELGAMRVAPQVPDGASSPGHGEL